MINCDAKQQAVKHKISDFSNFSVDEIKENMLKSGCWPFLKQRPYDIIANPNDVPKSIFVSTLNTAPISADLEIILNEQKEEFKTGISLLKKLTKGDLNICLEKNHNSFINSIEGVKVHHINDLHPAGNVGVQIHHIDPVNSGERVWVVGAEDVALIGKFFMTGEYNPTRTIAVSGPPVKYPQYYKTIAGSSLSEIIQDAGIDTSEDLRYINGDVLTGRSVEKDNYLGFYNNTFSVFLMYGIISFLSQT